jgi:alanyl-tRNA synthetase
VRADEIRRTFLDFYAARGHKVFPSASLVPDDPTLLLTVAGMVPFKQYFTGERQMDPPRAVSVQKCARTNDIENVGLTARHQTLFEMLGNFSFGDYFKREAIEWAWELSIDHYKLEPDRIWVSVYTKDDEAAKIWREVIGLPEKRIIRIGAPDNFWSIAGVRGPGGPNSELFYDRSPVPMKEFDDGDQLMEYYNLVFTEFDVGPDGEPIAPLPRKNVDTGGGLERTAQLLQGVPTAYETDVFKPIVDRAVDVTGRAYGKDHRADVSLRILAEHARSAMFLIGDGVLPSNEGRGYVLRRLIRRAVRHARLLGVDVPVFEALVDAAIDTMSGWYIELTTSRAFITQVAAAEEAHFSETIGRGIALLDSEIERAKTAKQTAIGGAPAFKLHDTFGFPLELTVEIAQEAGLGVDRDSFEELMGAQRDRARSARKIEMTDTDALREILAAAGPSEFNGYDRTSESATIAGIVRAGARAEAAAEGDEVELVLDATPFYPEGGGQIGDAGRIESDGAVVEVIDTQRKLGDAIVHVGRVLRGEVRAGAQALAVVDEERRAATQRSHTATHVMHATLRAALGDHARQAGSLVEPGRLRFDFPHFDRVPRETLDRIEAEVNARLIADDAVRPYETTMDEARSRGAMALFEEKYGDIVRVVEIGDYSIELCGGIHVTHTAQIGGVKILGEASIGSNLRRVEALTGAAAIEDWRTSRAVLDHVAALLKTSPADAPARIEKLMGELKTAEAEIRKAREAKERGAAADLAKDAETINGTRLLIGSVDGEVRVDELQKRAASIRETLGAPALVVLFGRFSGKAGIVAVVDKQSAGRIDPKRVIEGAAKLVDARPGGKGPLATAVGSNPSQIGAAVEAARAAAREVLA